MEYVLIGKIVNTHGVKGELKIESHTDFVNERFKSGSSVYLGDDKEQLIVKSKRLHKGFILVLFEGLEDINLVLKYKGENLYKALIDVKPLNNGEYYFKDLKDLDVYVSDKLVGKVLRVEEGVKHNYLRIKKDDEEKLVPYIKQFIKNVDLENRRIDINYIDGIL